MASGEQPPKKRKFYEQQPRLPSSPPLFQPPPPPLQTLVPPNSVGTPQSLPNDEIIKKRRHRDEIRSVYECYKRIKFCLSKNDSAFTPELEQAYLSLITASRGCTSVQRIVADLIPRYASKCPTALEAAAKVVINMYKWSMAVINRGEDVDSVAFQTAKSSILGLSDICCTASAVAPTSSVIRGICSAVFQNVLTFFISTFEGKNVFEIVGKETVRIQDSSEFFSKLKQKLLDENESSPIKLSKLSALSLLWIFFCYPKELVSAWFELLKSNASEGIQTGQYFLSQMTIRLDNGGGYSGDETGDEPGSNTGGELSIRSNEVSSENLASDGTHVSGDVSTVKKSCLLGLVLSKDPSLQSWMFSKYKKLCKLPSYKSLSNVRSSLEDVFKSFVEQMDLEDNQLDSDDDDSDPSKFIERAYLVPRFSNQPETGGELFGNEGHLRPSSGSYDNVFLARVSGQHLQSCSSIIPLESNIPGSNQDTGGTRSINCEIREHGDMPHGRSSVPRDLMNHQVLSPVTRSPLDFRSNSFDGRKHVHPERKDPMDFGSPLLRSSSGGVSNSFESPKPHLVSPYISTTTQIVWYSDGDGEAMDIFSASKQLWLGFSGSDASEAHIRFQLERFGAIEQFIFFPIKGFALVEYRNILDAVKAREYMRGHFPWNIKFMDIGLGTRGAMNGVAVGTSCHVYAGNVLSQWAKDEILHESRKVLYKGPYMVTDLSNEGALLMEFDIPEEAAAVMAHLRQHRKERSNYRPPYGGGPTNVGVSQTDGARSVPTPSNVGIRSNNHGNMSSSHVGSPFSVNHENQPMELVSPRVKSEIQGNSVQRGYSFQSKRAVTGSTEMLEPGTQKVDGNDNNLDMDPAQGGSHVFSRHTEQNWMYAKAGMELHSAPGGIPSVPVPTGTPSVPPPPPIHSSPFIRPVYLPPNSSWDPRGVNNNPHVNPISPGLMPNNFHGKPIVPPLISASVTPLAQVQGAPAQPFDQMFSVPKAAPQLSSLPPPLPEMPPPVPPSPPPLPQSQPPFVPPPPRSPPPPLLVQESSGVESSGQSLQYQWQGTLCKSGVQYCTIYAYRVDSDICKYSNAISEPIEWPAKLDMTKRTDFRHVKSTFTSTPAHKREICRLIPASAGDHKGFQDFVSYLKQRECSGVIKVPAVKSLWARLLFILPHSNETCSMLSIAPSTPDCLIALVLPKETNFEWV